MANLTGPGGMQRQRAPSTAEPHPCAGDNEAVSVYLADLTYTQQGLQSEIMPNAIGCVGSYAKKRLGDRISIRIFKRPEKFVAAIVDRPPRVVGFSNYAWNTRIAYAFAEAVKTRWPDTIIIFGGPNYPLIADEQKAFLASRPAIDFYVVKEGEAAFVHLLEALMAADFDPAAGHGMPSVHRFDPATGKVWLTEPCERLRDLTEIPSPYLAGWLDEYFDEGFMPIIQTNRGCPFTCTFCVEGENYYNKIYRSAADKVRAEIDYIGARMAPVMRRGDRADLFIADSNFAMFKEDVQTCQAIRDCQDRHGWPQYISVATGKNQKERILSAAELVRGALRLSGSVQSLDDDVLTNIKRKNVSAEQIMDVAIRGSRMGANTYSEVIVGLPGDTVDKFEKTVASLVESGFNSVEVYTLMLLPGAELANQETRQRFGFLTKYRVIPRCFGYFDFDGRTISVGEIEEVVVGTNTLSFADYVACRRMSLLIALFHNNGVFQLALDLLKSTGVKVWDCLKRISSLRQKPALANVLAAFENETRSELWDSRDELTAFLAHPRNVDRFISGELGSNLLYKYQAIAVLEAMDAVAETLAEAMESCLTEKVGKLNALQRRFVHEVVNICAFSTSRIFEGRHEVPRLVTQFDHEAVIDAGGFGRLEGELPTARPREIRFELDDHQKETIDRLIRTYGDDVRGYSRIYTRTNFKRLLRHPVPVP